VNQQLLRLIWERADSRCEYCRIPHPQYKLPFQIDHIIARQHGGETIDQNLALACFHCNRFKGPNIAGLDPQSKKLVPLFNPRTDVWQEHFTFEEAYIRGTTSIGRATIQVLAVNAPDLLQLRVELMREDAFQ
jgi:hypothetical protein